MQAARDAAAATRDAQRAAAAAAVAAAMRAQEDAAAAAAALSNPCSPRLRGSGKARQKSMAPDRREPPKVSHMQPMLCEVESMAHCVGMSLWGRASEHEQVVCMGAGAMGLRLVLAPPSPLPLVQHNSDHEGQPCFGGIKTGALPNVAAAYHLPSLAQAAASGAAECGALAGARAPGGALARACRYYQPIACVGITRPHCRALLARKKHPAMHNMMASTGPLLQATPAGRSLWPWP